MSKPLTIEELKALPVDEWVWIIKLSNDLVATTGYYRITEDKYYSAIYLLGICTRCFLYSDYGKTWVAYKNKEQAEAKGEMIELPCKVGDTVYRLHKVTKTITEWKVVRISLSKNEAVFLSEHSDTKYTSTLISFSESEIGKYFFVDKAQAETRLKELKGEK